jgi:hypothetical protein
VGFATARHHSTALPKRRLLLGARPNISKSSLDICDGPYGANDRWLIAAKAVKNTRLRGITKSQPCQRHIHTIATTP